LGATWLFKKARVLAIFDDLQTVLLLIPLKVLLIGPRWQLFAIAVIIFALLLVAYRWLNALNWPNTWPFVMTYAAAIVGVSELIHWTSVKIDPAVPIHLEVLLPAFAIGCVIKTPHGEDPHSNDAIEGSEEGPESEQEQFVSTIVSAVFMVLVGLSMPPIFGQKMEIGWGMIVLHVVAITIVSNLGKMVPAICYRKETDWRQRLALAIGMFPRGEVGAGVLVIALSYELAGPSITVAVLSLALNLMCTGLFILIVKRLIRAPAAAG
jgi:Kef-type K+ transport system membrane component KefB